MEKRERKGNWETEGLTADRDWQHKYNMYYKCNNLRVQVRKIPILPSSKVQMESVNRLFSRNSGHAQICPFCTTPSWHAWSLCYIGGMVSTLLMRGVLLSETQHRKCFLCYVWRKTTCTDCVWLLVRCLKVRTARSCLFVFFLNLVLESQNSLPDAQETMQRAQLQTSLQHHGVCFLAWTYTHLSFMWGCLCWNMRVGWLTYSLLNVCKHCVCLWV